MNTEEKQTEEIAETAELTWKVHPFKESVKTSVIVIAIIILICGIVYIIFRQIFWPILSFVFLFLSLTSFFFPTTFYLDEKGVKVKRAITTITRPWSAFRGFYWDKNGVQLTPFTYPSRLDSYRGLFLRFDNNMEEVLEFINQHLKKVSSKKPETKEKEDE